MVKNIGNSRVYCLALLFCAVTGLPACSRGSGHATGGGSGGPSVSFGGQWEGTWIPQGSGLEGAGSGLLGTVSLQLDQAGTSVTGTATFVGHPCLTSCTVSCEVNGHDMSGWFNTSSGQMMFSGSCPESGHCTGSHHANTLTATYQILDGPCAGETGTLQAEPVAYGSNAAPGVVIQQIGELFLVDRSSGKVARLPVFQGP